jgi:hypothetical protein
MLSAFQKAKLLKVNTLKVSKMFSLLMLSIYLKVDKKSDTAIQCELKYYTDHRGLRMNTAQNVRSLFYPKLMRYP